jgi:cobalt/nickel transport system permease protein
VKLVTFALLLFLISIARTAPALWLFLVMGLVLALLSSVPPVLFVKRVLLFVPLFSAVIVLPALFNVITPGEPLWVVLRLRASYSWGPYTLPQDIAVTRQGLAAGIVFVSRVTASVSYAVLLTLTTRWTDIFAGLRALFVPRVFVMTLAMTYRYIFVLLRLIQDMYRARKSRTIRADTASRERSWVASRIGFLFRKSAEMSRDIYLAMVSRGYHGEVIVMDRFRAGPADLVWAFSVSCAGGLIIAWERGLLR